MKKILYPLPLMLILIATFLRCAYLPTLPPGLNFDEAGSGVIALEILHGAPKLWWRIGGGQEPLWPYLIALFIATFGNIPFTLRLPSAFIGILTIAAVYPLALTLFPNWHGRRIALFTAIGLTLSEWHLHFSRLGFRAILLPLLSTLAFYFFWKGADEELRIKKEELRIKKEEEVLNSRNSLIRNSSLNSQFLIRNSFVSALFFALAMYAYLAARLLPFVLLLFFIIARLLGNSHLFPKKHILTFYAMLITFLTPFIIYFLLNPTDLTARSATVSIFNPVWNNHDFIGTLERTMTVTLGTFLGLSGDPNPLVNLPNQSALSFILVPFFIFGLLSSLYQRSSAHLLILCWWSIMLLPAILAPEGAPHHLRLIGTIVPTYLLVSIGLDELMQKLDRLKKPSFYHARCGFVIRNGYLADLQSASRLQIDSISATDYKSVEVGEQLQKPSFYVWRLIPLVIYAIVGYQTTTNYFIRWPISVDFTLPFDLYALHLADDIAHAPSQVAYVLPMDIRAGEEARHYTLDYLLANPFHSNELKYRYLPVDEHNAETVLSQAIQNKTELRVVRWTADKHHAADEKEIITYLLETNAVFVSRQSWPIYEVETYRNLSISFTLPAINQPIEANFDNLLQLKAAFVKPTVSVGNWLPVAITLVPLAPMDTDYKASIRLLSATGERLVQKDRQLRHNFHQGTSLWPPETVNEYYLLAVPAQTPPGDYMVVVVIYHPTTLAPLVANGLVEIPLGHVRVYP